MPPTSTSLLPNLFRAGLIALGLAAAVPCLAAKKDLPKLDVSRGEKLYQQYCSSCHGKTGRGDGPVADSFKKPLPDLTRMARRRGGKLNLLDIAAFIDGRTDVRAHGKPDMPVWGYRFAKNLPEGDFKEEIVHGQLLVVVKYLESIQR